MPRLLGAEKRKGSVIMESNVYGECPRHKGHSMIDCPICSMEKGNDFVFDILKTNDIILPPCDSASGKSAHIDELKPETELDTELNADNSMGRETLTYFNPETGKVQRLFDEETLIPIADKNNVVTGTTKG